MRNLDLNDTIAAIATSVGEAAEFVRHYPILNICQPDIVIFSHKLIIQCDGDWWHANPKFYSFSSLSRIQRNNIKRDKHQDYLLKKKGWDIIRLWEREIKRNVLGCVDKIEDFLKGRGPCKT